MGEIGHPLSQTFNFCCHSANPSSHDLGDVISIHSLQSS